MKSMNTPRPVNFRTLDLNLLRVFDVVMSELSLTKAAQLLSLTQPAVSNALRRLRDSLDDPLLQRKGQGLEPTPRALALWPVVRETLQQLEQTLAPGVFDPSIARSTFVLAMADATAAELIPGVSDILEHEAPSVALRVLPLTTRDPRPLLAQENMDMAVGYFPAVLADLTAKAQAGTPMGFDHQRLFNGEYVCVMRHGHPLSKHALTLDAYCASRHLLVSFSGRPFGFVDEALAALGRKRQIVLTVNQFATAGRVVAQSNLLAVLPRHFLRVTEMADALLVQELPFDVPQIHIDMLWRRHERDAGAHQWLRDTVVRASRSAWAQALTGPA
jgi:DNA-binding transcriptional LysR family regulator